MSTFTPQKPLPLQEDLIAVGTSPMPRDIEPSAAAAVSMASRQGLSPSAREFTPVSVTPVPLATAATPSAVPTASTSKTPPSAEASANKPHRLMVQISFDWSVMAECNLATCTISDLYIEVAAKMGTTNAKNFMLYFEGTPLSPSFVKLLDVGIGNFGTLSCVLNNAEQTPSPTAQLPKVPEVPASTSPMGMTPTRVNVQAQMQQQLQQLQMQHTVLQQQKTQSAKIAQLQARISHLANSPLPPTQYQGQMLGVLRYQLAIEMNQLEQLKIAAEFGLPPPPPLPQSGFASVMQSSGGMPLSQSTSPFTPPPAAAMGMGMGATPTPLAPPMVGTSPTSLGGSPTLAPFQPSLSTSPASSSPTSAGASGGCINLTALASKFSSFATSPGGSRGLIDALRTTQNIGKVVDLIIQDLQDMVGLATDEHGAEVLKKLAEVSTPKQQSALLEMCVKSRPELLEIAESACGCDILMTLMESSAADAVGLEANLIKMVTLISADVTPFLTTDAKKLIMKILIRNVPETAMTGFWASLMDKAVAISCDTKGCVGIKKCIDLAPAKVRAALVSRIMDHSSMLITNEYGNYVVQHIFDAATVAALWSKISDERTFIRYATDKIASHVIEKLIKQGTEETFRSIMKVIMRPAIVSTIIKDQYGNYIVQCSIERMPSDLVMPMREAIAPYLGDSQFGHKIEQKVTRRVKELNAAETKQSKAASDIMARIEAAAAAVKAEPSVDVPQQQQAQPQQQPMLAP